MDIDDSSSDFLDEIVYILESQIRYDLSSKLVRLLSEFGIVIDSSYTPKDHQLTNIQDKILDNQMDRDSIPETIPPVGITKDGFHYLK